MNFKVPKNTEKYEWTKHSLMKMQHYGLTAQRVLRVINAPARKEEGVVEKTIAVMQPTSVSTKEGKRVWTSEIWAMYQIRGSRNVKRGSQDKILKTIGKKPIKIISAWRYPGVSPKNNPIPEEIIREMADLA
ncbi:MAG: hypothetical protein WC238_00845 [Parcubacteria group bacterium]|jgi:hypothetical protein